MSTESGKPTKRVVRSPNFKTITATNFGLRLNDNLCELIFAYETGNPDGDVVIEESAVILTPRSLKIFHELLNRALPAFEQEIGGIALPPGKEKELQAAVKASGMKTKDSSAN